ncbi:filamentous hemagglutinin N-terminal domain-containing protein [Blastomonas fulva]|uniref:two-partner secretion domain-containing protein n=1 Tax=Blastomonas fulva TaxID=1550728 RepID=UPI0025A4194D|nr:filamentous hemagglutinin N-terminal domain-containing protein [Blastomonas fulva]MDM7927569.1 filamentous hemagglutinin N-terminal domain-containing protein [Blastomonas fulva]MDM7965332.1 filamentous hemagglutinin N-terminal domain-containing protein [Blastomonas fulva]
MRRWLITSTALALAAGAMPVAAQDALTTQTAITPDTLPSLSTGTTATTDGANTTIGGGVRAGDNLFHSFARFSLGPGDTARWTASDSATIRNVINRVTGGERSFIGGTIDASAMPGADFYFINPAGIVFGDGAFVDVGGTAHFSTAHQLGFADGTVLVSGTASGSTFSMADPARFGFLGGNNQPIAFLATGELGDELARGVAAGRLTLSASDITFASASLAASTLALRAVGQGRGNVGISAAPDQGLRGGRIDLDDSSIFIDTGGHVALAAGSLRLDTFSEIGVVTSASGRPAIDVRADLVDLVSGELRVSGVAGLAERGGDIRVRASDLIVRRQGAIRTESMLAGGGGTILLDGDVVHIDGGSVTATGLSAPGQSVGDIVVRARLLKITEIGLLSTTLFQATGDTMPTGTTGNIVIDAGRIEIDSTGLILAQSQSSTASGPGSITIRADSMAIGLGLVSTGTASSTAAGSIDITVRGLLELTGFGGIQSVSQGLGDAGAITIRAGTLRMIDDVGGPLISSQTEIPRPQEFTRLSDYTGSAGRIVIETDSLEMIGRSTISTASSSLGNAGDIVINTGRISLSGDAEITSSANALSVPPSDEDFEADPDLVPQFKIVPGPGRAGTIAIAATGTLSMTGGTISTATKGFGDAGAVMVAAERIEMGEGSRISSDAGGLAPGQAGTVLLIARDIVLANGAEVTTGSANATTAGAIVLLAEESVLITGSGSQVASTNSATELNMRTGGAAGNITVSAPRITLGPGGLITTSSRVGPAGQIDMLLPSTGLLRLAGGTNPAAIATSSGPGTGGRITIARPYALIADGGRIEALGQQRGANVQLATDFFIRSADNSNLLLVDGDLVVDSQVGNVSSGIDTPDISFGDAAGVLAGQCRAARSSGSVSRLAIDAVGPLALEGAQPAADGGCR